MVAEVDPGRAAQHRHLRQRFLKARSGPACALPKCSAPTRYPAEILRLGAYDIDGREPCVLLEEYRGATVHELRSRTTTSCAGSTRAAGERRGAGGAEVVHGDITPRMSGGTAARSSGSTSRRRPRRTRRHVGRGRPLGALQGVFTTVATRPEGGRRRSWASTAGSSTGCGPCSADLGAASRRPTPRRNCRYRAGWNDEPVIRDRARPRLFEGPWPTARPCEPSGAAAARHGDSTTRRVQRPRTVFL